MTTTLTVANRKGGVAKTSTAVSLAHGLALKGKSVLLVDVDPQGHVAPALGLEQEPGLFNLIVAGRTLREVSRQARPDLWVVPGNLRTGTAEAMLVYEKAQLDALAKVLGQKANARPDYVLMDTCPGRITRPREERCFGPTNPLV